ncbi:hypothetical protein FGO68_gene16004 [Halteria grandinella]|uniref:Uncharacterized protein n=1 Tax=Halteria grandinella TaxID=5974 RepID=A0A8J8P8N3_HALGN|nr:hypothetical protein FGO68_gene16004 [Halteria grandinella]
MYNLTIQDSSFTRFSSCGAVLSNYHTSDIALTPPEGKVWLLAPRYKGYATEWQKAANQFLRNRYCLHKPQFYEDIEETTISGTRWAISSFERFNVNNFTNEIRILGNTFSNFNYLKAYHLEGEEDRMVHFLDQVTKDSLRNMGLIIAFRDNFNASFASIEGNLFKDTFMAIQILQEFGGSSAQVNQNIFGHQYYDEPYAQQHHLISIANVTDSLIVINHNTFQNISLSGPLINLEEQPGQITTPFIIANNIFETVMGFLNSNVIQIARQIFITGSGIDIDYKFLAPFVDMKPDFEDLFEKESYSLQMLQGGGNIIIMGNQFNEICGQTKVDAAIMLIGVRHDISYQRANFMNNFPILSIEYFKDRFKSLSTEGLEELLFKDVRINHPRIGEISLRRIGVNISGNIYSDICMGADKYYYNWFEDTTDLDARGALARFYFIPQVNLFNETYVNIRDCSGWSLTYTDYVQKKIKNIPEILGRTFYNEDFNYDFSIPSYLQDTLSASLLVVSYCTHIFLQGTFDNVWLFDRIGALSRTQSQALILFIEYSNGIVVIGDEIETSTFQNLNGFLNDRTIGSKMLLDDIQLTQDEKFSQYGTGSIMFKVHSTENEFQVVKMQNIVIKDSYFAANKDSMYFDKKTLRCPAIISTDMGDESYDNMPDIVLLFNISLINVQFDGANHYFEILARDIQLDTLNFERLGFREAPGSDAFVVQAAQEDRIVRNPKIPAGLIKLMLFTSDHDQQNDITIINVKIDRVDPVLGPFPLILVERSYDQLTYIESNIILDNVLIKDSLLKGNEDELLIPGASLFKIETAKELSINVQVSQLNMEKVFSKCKFYHFYQYLHRWHL